MTNMNVIGKKEKIVAEYAFEVKLKEFLDILI